MTRSYLDMMNLKMNMQKYISVTFKHQGNIFTNIITICVIFESNHPFYMAFLLKRIGSLMLGRNVI